MKVYGRHNGALYEGEHPPKENFFGASWVSAGPTSDFTPHRPAVLTQQALSWPRLPGALDAMEAWQPFVPWLSGVLNFPAPCGDESSVGLTNCISLRLFECHWLFMPVHRAHRCRWM